MKGVASTDGCDLGPLEDRGMPDGWGDQVLDLFKTGPRVRSGDSFWPTEEAKCWPCTLCKWLAEGEGEGDEEDSRVHEEGAAVNDMLDIYIFEAQQQQQQRQQELLRHDDETMMHERERSKRDVQNVMCSLSVCVRGLDGWTD